MKKTGPRTSQSASQLIDARIEELGDWRGALLARLRRLIQEADPDIVEEWKWRGVPVWSHDGIVCTGETYKSIVKMTFARGAALDDPAKLFNASLEGNTRRAIDFHEGEKVNEKALKALVRAAVALNTAKKGKKQMKARSRQANPTAKAAARVTKSRKSATATRSARKPSAKSTPRASAAATKGGTGKVVLLSGGNPQIAKGDGDAPVQAYIAAMPGWKSAMGKRLDALIVRTVPNLHKAVKWNSPMYGVEGQGFFLGLHVFAKYIKVAFFRGTSLRPLPPRASKHPEVRYVDIYEDGFDEAQMTSWVKQAAALPGWIPGR